MPPASQHQVLGDALYPRVTRACEAASLGRLAAKLTGMLLQLDVAVLLKMLDDTDPAEANALLAKSIDEALGHLHALSPETAPPTLYTHGWLRASRHE